MINKSSIINNIKFTIKLCLFEISIVGFLCELLFTEVINGLVSYVRSVLTLKHTNAMIDSLFLYSNYQLLLNINCKQKKC